MGAIASIEARLIQQLQAGDPDAGRQFVRDYYPDVYHYLLYLTHRPDAAEDLAQETFLKAWRHLAAFEGRSSLRVWLHRIAHREFLQAARSQRPTASLDEMAEPLTLDGAEWAEAVELREVIGKLPLPEREVVVLHYLYGHSCQEIAGIVHAPVTSVKDRLRRARARLQRELGEGDLPYLNEPSFPMRQWAWLPLDEIYALEAGLGTAKRPWPGAGLGAAAEQKMLEERAMERREFLRHAAVGAAGLMILPETEKEVVDNRLVQKVTCACKGTALSDVCDRLGSETGVRLSAGPSVADEKVTLFCEKLSLREVMRQLSRPFGYTWLRSGTPGQYRYELVQDLRSQLLEEELRNRGRNAALLALDREMQRYRPYLDLSPNEALARARTAPPADKELLEHLAKQPWGAIQMYFRLTSGDFDALRAGQTLTFSADQRSANQPLPTNAAERVQMLPADVAHGVLQSWRDSRIRRRPGAAETGAEPFDFETAAKLPDGLPPLDVPEARPLVTLRLDETELGQFTLNGGSGIAIGGHSGTITDDLALGVIPAVHDPENRITNARLAHDPALRPQISMRAEPSCRREPAADSHGDQPAAARVTSADVLDAMHRASGLPIVADFFTRLYEPGAVTVTEQPLFDALNHLADTMHLRWSKEAGTREVGAWLQFRSASFYDDQLKEVPNRLLARWSASRRQHGTLTLDDLIEIAQLSDVQLDSGTMAEGAQDCWSLKEWGLARNLYGLRPYLRFLAGFSPAQRQEAMSPQGLAFGRMSHTQQQQYMALALQDRGVASRLQSVEELAGANLRVDYTVPGWLQWVPPLPKGEPYWKTLLPSPVRERSREAVLHAARQADSRADELQIVPTELALTLAFLWGNASARLYAHLVRATPTSTRIITWTKQGENEYLVDGTRCA